MQIKSDCHFLTISISVMVLISCLCTGCATTPEITVKTERLPLKAVVFFPEEFRSKVVKSGLDALYAGPINVGESSTEVFKKIFSQLFYDVEFINEKSTIKDDQILLVPEIKDVRRNNMSFHITYNLIIFNPRNQIIYETSARGSAHSNFTDAFTGISKGFSTAFGEAQVDALNKIIYRLSSSRELIDYARTSREAKRYESNVEKKEFLTGAATLPDQSRAVDRGKFNEIDRHQNWALVVGVSSYQDSRIPNLRYASSDAESFYGWLVSPNGGRYAPSNIKLLVNEKATSINIKNALYEWLKNALEEDIVTIYFAGHGSSDSPDSLHNLYFLSYDTEYTNIASTGFPMWDIETAIKRFIKAKKVIVIADACHSGGIGQAFDVARRTNMSIKVSPISLGFQHLSQIGDGICVISASAENQFSQESQQWGGGRGVFTHFLLKGLEGEADYNQDKRVTLGELIPFISEKVRRETKSAQSPTVAGKFDPAISIGR
jgi:hypothetical protein